MKVLEGLRYTKSHEWVKVDGDACYVGITDHAQDTLGSIVFVDLPNVGDSFKKGDSFGAIESVKAASDLYIPVSGEILEVHMALEDTPELINEDAYENWIIKVKLSDPSEIDALLDAKAYEKIED